MVDLTYQTSEVLNLSDISTESWIALNLRFKTIMITKDQFVILYNEQSLEEHKERFILSHLGFDPDNEGDDWIPETEYQNYDTSDRIQVMEKLNTNWNFYENPFDPFDYPEPLEEEEEDAELQSAIKELESLKDIKTFILLKIRLARERSYNPYYPYGEDSAIEEEFDCNVYQEYIEYKQKLIKIIRKLKED